MSIRAVLFDAAGTLIETREPVGETYARVSQEHSAPISAWRLGEAFARAMSAAPPLAFPGAPLGEIAALEKQWWHDRVRATFLSADSAVRPEDFEHCFETLFAHFAQPEAWTLREGAEEALEVLQDHGHKLAVVSNFDRRLMPLLRGLGIAHRFDTVVLPSDVGAAKPDPTIFLHALAALGTAPSEAVFVGDDAVRDLEAGKAQGLYAIDVTTLATLASLPAAIGELMSIKESSQ
jgi:putative hydrolase of the HAD superfamily